MVYKGCQRKMIVIKNTGSEFFDAAYFILKEGKSEKENCTDMIKEANRIVSENTVCENLTKSKKFVRPSVLTFISGLCTGICSAFLVYLFFM